MNFKTKQQIRIDIISQYLNGELRSEDACCALEIGERQFRRLVKGFREQGVASLIHGNKGRIPHNKTSMKVSNKIIQLYLGRYNGLNLVHFIEKLRENNSHEFDSIPTYTTIRNLLLQEGLIIPYQKKAKRKSHPRRKRYEKEGLMVQIDGSPHRWIHDCSPFCLTAAIDDATGKILAAKFTPTETTFAAMDVVEQIINKYGVFQMLYSDKAGIYGGGKRQGFTNMNRAMNELGIISIQANSPQAKGRIERLFKTLQDRLCSEIRLRGIKNIEAANRYLEEFITAYNLKFSVSAKDQRPAYRKLEELIDLNEVLTIRDHRKIGEGEILSFEGHKYLVSRENGHSLIGKTVEIRRYRDGKLEMFLLNGVKLAYECFEDLKRVA
ncbi:MAG: ISNCY family transposase [Halobacteriovoraceae bacterium]|nr:ISNCY family transposase [Halobacteriovoraceae bacterium]MCB9062258.1 ISNCY family transposase [Halobacteriovoraceae bacterium]MCB9063109.1 ISNCY family transposase [Halobacteriovoraceae bacterium]MCB9063195.1 ISNCY family transposase [Halobacteriovoraceae bacterium]